MKKQALVQIVCVPPYYDVSGDDYVSAGDALAVIHYINAFVPECEGESCNGSLATPAILTLLVNAPADLIALLALDQAENLPGRQRR